MKNETDSNLAVVAAGPQSSVLSPQSASVEAVTMMAIVARAAADPNVDVAKMERLYAMAKEEREWNAERAFNEAMRRAQERMPVIPKDATNASTNSRFAQLETLKKRALPIITENGFAMQFSQADGAPAGKIRMRCKVSHEGGHSEIHFLDLSPDDTGMKGMKNKTGIHGEGSTFTYGERYLTKLIFNITIVGEDDDGNRGRKPKPEGAGSLDGAESLGKSIFQFVDRAKTENKTILATIVGERPAKVPDHIGVFVVEEGKVVA